LKYSAKSLRVDDVASPHQPAAHRLEPGRRLGGPVGGLIAITLLVMIVINGSCTWARTTASPGFGGF
jgi:hypothetical protein